MERVVSCGKRFLASALWERLGSLGAARVLWLLSVGCIPAVCKPLFSGFYDNERVLSFAE